MHPCNSSFKSKLALWFYEVDLMTGDSKLSRFFSINISSESIDPTEVIPDSMCNPLIFMWGSVSSSKVDEIVDDCDHVKRD